MAVEPASSTFSSSPDHAAVHHSPWHSPVPYLFGGLGAMLALITFALLILAWSYFKLYREMNDDLEAGNNNGEDKLQEHCKASPTVFEDKYLVIMAGQAKPTFLATPISSSVTNLFDVGSISMEKLSTTEMEMMEEKHEIHDHYSSDQV